nr:Chain SE0, 40S ribosomal protein S4 [Spraguea lophii 42_110]7QJH_RE0 Chain RE0, 40S ribosomal protein S4 [Spraguea lophii 42_110]7QJH_SE0 Chain SE0, 40S ribosomal protein S4 [Spraguea lophii 42_110]8BR3_SE0 Chain SE0, 40S ribosomal protein S4 [Spraguea lophii 42_110]8P5D_SE0 Chain SE0, 40S ribosomal protein S4 [Spraguea lophii 42_110]8P60_RE0 Chain RE0, 40S ribosomal protein S4 [Spraguea lophii 42_110]8P60_SE0 Chain SE0, 40S ribosomal protein S4 [Spraguea lophii 42_110]
MVRGPRKHLKRLNAPKSWSLDKNGGVFAPRTSTGPHSMQESIPLCLLLTRILKVASNNKEIKHIMKNRLITVNGNIRTDSRYPVGIMDVLSIKKTNEHYRLLYNIAGKFVLHKITEEEAQYRIAKVTNKKVVKGNIPHTYTSCGGSFKYADPSISIGDSVKIDIKTSKIVENSSLEVGKVVYLIKGKNIGCLGVITGIEKREGTHDIVNIVDKVGRNFSTIFSNILVVGADDNPWVTFTKDEGIKYSEYEQSIKEYGPMNEEKEEESIPEVVETSEVETR